MSASMRPWGTAVLLLAAACGDRVPEHAGPKAVRQPLDEVPLQGPAPALSATRQLRRLMLNLEGKEPTLDDYERATLAAADGGFEAFYAAQVDQALASAEFAAEILSYGHDYLAIGDYTRGSIEGMIGQNFKGSQAVALKPCLPGTLHEGKLGHFRSTPRQGDAPAICDSATAPVAAVEPWWAPGTTVQTIGRAGLSNTSWKGLDCGRVSMEDTDGNFADRSDTDPGCGCGPNLLYCYTYRAYTTMPYPMSVDSNPYIEDSLRRYLHEEPARLFAHVVLNDLPFSDLVLGNYTVAPRGLQHFYWRWGRMNSKNAAVSDATAFWRTASEDWQRVTFQSLHPNLLDDRSYKFDPRVEDGDPIGVPSAGVFSMVGPASWHPRERVRAARWLEVFACRTFTAPDASMQFPPFTGDPYKGGTCSYCHATIDPVAIHFKRIEIEEDAPRHGLGHINFGGIGDWSWRRTFQTHIVDSRAPGGAFWYQPYGRWNVNFAPDTFLTPVTQARITANDDARFIDFMPPGAQLFGMESDGTIGPLGFSKVLVASGEFDRCAVQRLYQRFIGRPLDVTRQADLERELVADFVAGGRKVRPFIKHLVARDETRRGL